jgi:hypothetical protein
MWSIVSAKSHLSEVLRLARKGQPQVIGTQDPCVVVSTAQFEANFADHDGAWLVEQAAKLANTINLPSRSEDRVDLVLGQ